MAEPAPPVKGARSNENDEGQQSPGIFSFPVRIIENPDDTQHTREREEKSDRHETDDLQAQRTAANAAERSASASEWQVIAAWWQVGIAIGGTLALLYSLWLTRAALKEARSSSASAEITAKVALGIELPIIKLRIAGIDLNALDAPVPESGGYACFHFCGQPPTHTVIPNLPFRNFGRTPAFPISVLLGHSVVHELECPPCYTKVYPLDQSEVIRPEPQDEPFVARIHYGINLTEKEGALLKSDKAALWVFGLFRYRDFMDDIHDTKFCFWVRDLDSGADHYRFINSIAAPACYIGTSEYDVQQAQQS